MVWSIITVMQTTLSILTHLIIINLLPTIWVVISKISTCMLTLKTKFLVLLCYHLSSNSLNSLCLIMSLILMTTRLSKALILRREIWYWSLWELEGLQSSQVKRTLQNAKLFKSWICCRFQIHLCILACVMSCEFSGKAVMKFLPAQFPRIDVNVFEAILSNQRFSVWPNTETFL